MADYDERKFQNKLIQSPPFILTTSVCQHSRRPLVQPNGGDRDGQEGKKEGQGAKRSEKIAPDR